jgi:hypothetical protein
MTTPSIANETQTEFVRRKPVRCDNCGQDTTDAHADPRPENRGNALCWTCWTHAMAGMVKRAGDCRRPNRRRGRFS